MSKSIFRITLFVALVITWACKEKSHEHEHGHDHGDEVVSENQVLYDEVMKIHDEVMPKMQDIHNRKQALQEKITKATDAQKKNIQIQIAKLDSAQESMMVWMREFSPIPDSAGKEKAREYLEGQMEKVKKVREDMMNALKETEEQPK